MQSRKFFTDRLASVNCESARGCKKKLLLTITITSDRSATNTAACTINTTFGFCLMGFS